MALVMENFVLSGLCFLWRSQQYCEQAVSLFLRTVINAEPWAYWINIDRVEAKA